MRWNKVATLFDVGSVQDAHGGVRYAKSNEVTVFANPRHLGMEAWAAARSHDLHADVSLQVRSMEYKGQSRCELDGQLYEVERAYDVGEYTTLTLKHRLGDDWGSDG